MLISEVRQKTANTAHILICENFGGGPERVHTAAGHEGSMGEDGRQLVCAVGCEYHTAQSLGSYRVDEDFEGCSRCCVKPIKRFVQAIVAM